MNPIRVLICDDHFMVRQGLATYFGLQDDFEVVGEAADGRKAVEMVRQLKPDVVLMDLMMPELDGLSALRELKGTGARVIILTSFLDLEKAMSCIEEGALGFLTKDIEPADLVDAIRAVHRGEPRLHPEVMKRLMVRTAQPHQPRRRELLTPRELDVLRALAHGLTNREIAEKLVISETTVKTHISSILSKLQLTDRTQAALWAVREKLVDE
ncbi:NarL family two-component system response regulator LiaR [Symbiobacterium terraclitae]|uniref:Stage 0 sporulation protein A homolog n=1 Tax=Symbiobacterium terraclitae TaxID=557451 RepID=A0ABS4JPA8_9FIRM|nr:response regulator transcription factor [Symbiobacterium terraclitae]MBP2017369.1 NarL family two-component system response regulator LiaR [Symbiobacterium terraclitae]